MQIGDKYRTWLAILVGIIMGHLITILQDYIRSNPELYPLKDLIPILIGGGMGFIISLYLTRIRTLNHRLRDQLKKLESLLPMCSHCKKVKTEFGDDMNPNHWKDIDEYLLETSNTKFTHSICPHCMRKYYEDYADEKLSPS